MREIELYARGMRIADSDGNQIPIGARPVVQWREKVGFTVALQSGSFGAGSYKYAFDYDRDFLHSEPCNSGECAVSNGVLTFEVTFNSVRQAEATNGRLKPIPFYIQITKDGEDSSAEYVLDDAIWAAGCVWDGRIPPAPEAPNYYTKTEVDEIADGKLDKPEEAGEEGYVLGLAEDGSTAWIPNGGGGSWGHISGDIENQTDLMGKLADKANLVNGKLRHDEMPAVNWNDVQSKPTFSQVATSGNYADLSNKPAIPASLSDLASDTSHRTVTDEDKAAWDDKSDFSGSYNDLTDKPSIPPAQVQSDWTETNTGSKAFVKNKPTLATVATSGSYNDLNNKPTIPPAQVQADWSQSNTSAADYIKNKPIIPSGSDYIPQSQKGTANGVPTLNSSAKIPYSQLPDGKPITTISASDSTYNLVDGCFEHTPSAAPTYTLPAVTDATRTHWIVLTVNFSNTQSIAFEDSLGTTIAPLDTLEIASGDVVEYLCRYDSLQSKWVIACGKLNA